jgi:hypothetical protein
VPEESADEDARIEAVSTMVDHVRIKILPRLVSRPELAPRHYAAAALARCNRLLAGMLLLRTAGYPDLVGIFLRSLLEAWYTGLYFLLAPDEAMRRSSAAHVLQLTKLDPTRWGDQQTIIDQMFMGPQALPWEAVSRRVGELLAERGHAEAKSTAEAMYEVLYRGESMMSVHGGVGSLIGHFDMPVSTSPPPSIGILEVRREPDEATAARIRWAASLECYLARAVAEEFGLRYEELERLGALFGDEE